MMKKGISVFIGSVLLIMLTVLVGAIVANWTATVAKDTSSSVEDQNLDQLNCARGNVFIRNVTYNCSKSCASGTFHMINATVENTGSIELMFRNMTIITTSGKLFGYSMNETKIISVGSSSLFMNISATACTDINSSIDSVKIGSMNCGDVYDSFPGSLVQYVECT